MGTLAEQAIARGQRPMPASALRAHDHEVNQPCAGAATVSALTLPLVLRLLRPYIEAISIVAGISFPFIAVSACHAAYRTDIDIFVRWAEHLGNGPPSVYEADANYPVFGVLTSAGAVGWLRHCFASADGAFDAATVFRQYLAGWNAVLFLLLGWLAKLIRLRMPWTIALLVAVVPSSWVGSALWGQIDAVTQCMLMAPLVATALLFRQVRQGRLGLALVANGLSVLFLGLALMTKQLAVFSAPLLMAFVTLGVMRIAARWKRTGFALAVASTLVPLGLLFAFDRTWPVPAGYHGSSLLYVWMGGRSNHDEVLGNGVNIWQLLGRDVNGRSSEPFWSLRLGTTDIQLRPGQCGKALFLAVSLLTALLWARSLNRGRSLVQAFQSFRGLDLEGTIAVTLFALGIHNLAMSTLLCGVHERYLYHACIFLLFGSLAIHQRSMGRVSWRTPVAVIFSAACYGGFVFSNMAPLVGLFFPLQRRECLATLSVVLLIVLTDVLWRIGRAHPRRAAESHSAS